MYEDRRQKAVEIASVALDRLADGAPLEGVYRRALRVAALLGHSFWRGWFTLQLIGMVGNVRLTDSGLPDAMAAELPDKTERDYVGKAVIKDHLSMRSMPILGDECYGGSVDSLERFALARIRLLHEAGVSGEVLQDCQQWRVMYERHKTRVQSYLLGIEAEPRSGG